MNTHRLPLDRAHTTREHPGESIDDTRNWTGLGLIGLGTATLGMALVAAGEPRIRLRHQQGPLVLRRVFSPSRMWAARGRRLLYVRSV